MARRFLRRVRVQIGDSDVGLQVEDLLIKFRLRRATTDTPADGHVLIYNLSDDSEQRVHQRGVRCRVEAGYQGDVALLFDGDVRRVSRQRDGHNRIVRVDVAGNATKQQGAIFLKTYEGAVAVRDIVRDAVATMGLELGPLDLIPADAQEIDYTYHGPTRVLLSPYGLLRPYGLHAYEDNGVMRISASSGRQPGRPPQRYRRQSEQTGMIGTPTITDDGIRLKSLIDGRLRLDTRIRVVSTLLDPDTLLEGGRGRAPRRQPQPAPLRRR